MIYIVEFCIQSTGCKVLACPIGLCIGRTIGNFCVVHIAGIIGKEYLEVIYHYGITFIDFITSSTTSTAKLYILQ